MTTQNKLTFILFHCMNELKCSLKSEIGQDPVLSYYFKEYQYWPGAVAHAYNPQTLCGRSGQIT